MGMASDSAAQRGKYWAILTALIAWSILVFSGVLPGINQVTYGFAGYYGASYAILHGGASALTDDTRFPTWVTQAGISGIHEVFAGNVPTAALVMIPLTAIPPATAQTIWLCFDLGMLVGCAWLAGRIFAPDNFVARWWIAAGFALLMPV